MPDPSSARPDEGESGSTRAASRQACSASLSRLSHVVTKLQKRGYGIVVVAEGACARGDGMSIKGGATEGRQEVLLGGIAERVVEDARRAGSRVARGVARAPLASTLQGEAGDDRSRLLQGREPDRVGPYRGDETPGPGAPAWKDASGATRSCQTWPVQ